MKQHLEILYYINQSNDSVILSNLDTPDILKTAGRLSNLVQPCIKEIIEAATKVKNSVEIGLKELNNIENLSQNYQQNLKGSTSELTLVELGIFTGYSFKVLQLLRKTKKIILADSKEYWLKEFNILKNKWFIDNKSNFKKGIGWHEKENFLDELKLLKANHVYKNRKLFKASLQLLFEWINIFMIREKMDIYCKFLDSNQSNIYQKRTSIIFNKLNLSNWLIEVDEFISCSNLKSSVTLDPIFNCVWGDLAWELVDKTQTQYIQELESSINNFFDKKEKLLTIVFDGVIQIYNDVLNKQKYYQQEIPQESQDSKIWIDTQRAKLLTLQSLLEDALNFKV